MVRLPGSAGPPPPCPQAARHAAGVGLADERSCPWWAASVGWRWCWPVPEPPPGEGVPERPGARPPSAQPATRPRPECRAPDRATAAAMLITTGAWRRDLAGLRPRRLQAARMFAYGATQAEIARTFGVSRQAARRPRTRT